MLAWLIPGGNVVAALGSAFSLFLKFVTSTIGMVLMAAVVAYGVGHHQAAKKCNAEKLASELAAAKADIAVANRAAGLAQKQAADLDEANRANQDKVNDLSNDLAKRPDRKCGLSRRDALRLRGIK